MFLFVLLTRINSDLIDTTAKNNYSKSVHYGNPYGFVLLFLLGSWEQPGYQGFVRLTFLKSMFLTYSSPYFLKYEQYCSTD